MRPSPSPFPARLSALLAGLALLALAPGGATPVSARPGAASHGQPGVPGAARPPASFAPPQAARLTPDDYGRFESLGFDVALSDDGAWLAVPVRRVDGTSELRVRRVQAPGDEPFHVAPEGAAPAFADGSRFLAYRVGHAEAERQRLQEQGEPVRDRAGLLDLDSGDHETFDDVRELSFSPDGAFLALQRYPAERSGDGDGGGRGGGDGGGGDTTAEGLAADAADAADLLIRDLASGATILLGNVSAWEWQDGGHLLALAVATPDGTGNGIHLHDPATGVLRVLASGEARFRGLTWREDSSDLAALRSVHDAGHEEPTHQVLVWRDLAADAAAAPTVLDPLAMAAFPAATRIVDFRKPRWSDDGSVLFVGVREWEARDDADEGDGAAGGEDSPGSRGAGDERPAGEGPGEGGDPEPGGEDDGPADRDEEELADVWIWHADDERIVPMQRLQEQRDRRRNHLAAWHLDDDRFVVLGTDLRQDVELLPGQRHGVVRDTDPYRFESMFGRTWQDVWLVDVETGERSRVVEKVRYHEGASPDGRHLLYFSGEDHFAYEIATGAHHDLTGDIDASFVDVDHDYPVEQRPSWGVGGWVEGGDSVLLYDRYDVWRVSADGAWSTRLTASGDEEVRHRLVRLDREADAFDPEAPLYVSLYGRWTKQHGYGRIDAIRATDGRPGWAPGAERLVWLDRDVGGLRKATDADVTVWEVQGFDDSPDLFAGDMDLQPGHQVTRTNPFRDEYAWGRSELVDFESTTGRRLQAALHYPAGWEAGRTYPMIVYVYEMRSQAVHTFEPPSERDPYNFTVWTNEGYFVLQPDIVFRGRDPGVSAVEAVVPAVQAVVDRGLVDAARVGLVGHSWGGYEAAYIPTRTDTFAASVAGAPLTNFFSMFGTIHWNQGLPESGHFETGQARMDVPYWVDMEAYVRNSPVMFIHELGTPMLLAFGDADGTVDWHQGVEMYNYARRAGKQLVMLVYPGENHGLREKPNQIDYHHRILEWFGHYLKGEEAPRWITEGIPVLEREEELRRRSGG